jgi:hypothetical protein
MTRSVPLPVLLVAAGPAKQQRWTVLIRALMLIPHYVVLYFLAIALEVVAFIGWWGALFTGRLPEFAVNYISGFMRWSTRVQAYALLLTDQFPPFSLADEPAYPVRIAIPAPGKLNRAAVFFRVILVIPASLLNSLVTFGGTSIVGFIAWLIALITGQLPASLHQAYIAILRYGTRVNCYLFMLTAAYPNGLFGDGPAVQDGAVVPPAGAFDPAASYGQAPVDAGVSGYGPPAFGTPVDPAAWQPADWRLLLTRGARQLLGWFIGIGAVLYVAYAVLFAMLLGNTSNAIVTASNSIATTNNAIDTMNAANTTLSTAITNYQNAAQACTTVSCIETADGQAAAAFTTFANTLHNTPMPASAVAPANALYADATKLAQGFTKLSQLSPTVSDAQYQSTANSVGLTPAGNKFDQDNTALKNALNNSF